MNELQQAATNVTTRLRRLSRTYTIFTIIFICSTLASLVRVYQANQALEEYRKGVIIIGDLRTRLTEVMDQIDSVKAANIKISHDYDSIH